MPLASPSTAQHHAAPSSSRTGLAITALVTGALAAGGALVVGFLGVGLPYAWYVVVGLAILTLVLGPLSVGRRHHRSSAPGALAMVGTVGGVVALVLGVWGVTNVVRGTHTNQQISAASTPVLHTTAPAPAKVAPSTQPTTSAVGGTQIPFGQGYDLDNVHVEVDGPQGYHPSNLASTTDGSTITRAVEFTVIITNNSGQPLPANGVKLTGLVNGQQIGRVFDTTITNLNSDIAAGQTVTVPIAFNLPSASTPLVIGVDAQSMTSTDTVYYGGTV